MKPIEITEFMQPNNLGFAIIKNEKDYQKLTKNHTIFKHENTLITLVYDMVMTYQIPNKKRGTKWKKSTFSE